MHSQTEPHPGSHQPFFFQHTWQIIEQARNLQHTVSSPCPELCIWTESFCLAESHWQLLRNQYGSSIPTEPFHPNDKHHPAGLDAPLENTCSHLKKVSGDGFGWQWLKKLPARLAAGTEPHLSTGCHTHWNCPLMLFSGTVPHMQTQQLTNISIPHSDTPGNQE